jgi:hypothetical protein
MPTGVSIHIGLNHVDAKHYQGWDGALVACEFDAKDMERLAARAGYETQTLLTNEASTGAVTGALQDAATALSAGDILLLTYSGHGGQVPDRQGDEDDRMDETWVLFDRQLIDDELYALFGRFAAGVRIAVISDSCHSGTVARAAVETVGEERVAREMPGEGRSAFRLRGMPDDVMRDTYEANRAEYDEIQRSVPAFDESEIGASVILISGCQDNQTSLDGDRNGLFTQTLLGVWNRGAFRGGYRAFRRHIARKMPPWQSPNLYIVGAKDRAFANQRPFTI